jgi:UDP-N-acetylglucosamine--N-acetylmuramyl-(pentapeptide) pyrophosphoryl-undecaprenol N-acetylglucosamine transferase
MNTQNAINAQNPLATPLVALAAGGTGGHVFPAQALASELVARGCKLALVTDHRGASFGALPSEMAVHTVSAGRFSGGITANLGSLAAMVRSVIEAKHLLCEIKPSLVVGFGGYASLPTMFAARWQRLPTLIHEQNAVLGRANWLLAPMAESIAISFEEVARLHKRHKAKTTCTGNPVRPTISAIRNTPYPPLGTNDSLNLLVMGGSQGAAVFGHVLPDAVALMPAAARARLHISQQCRAEDMDRVKTIYEALNINAVIESFFDDVPQRLRQANLVIGRAGASTVAEATAAGRPAILVPYPFAMDDHQSANANTIAAGGGAWVFAERDFTASTLAAMLSSFLDVPRTLQDAAAVSRELGIPDAAARLADAAWALLPPNGKGRTSGDAASSPPPFSRETAA